MDLHKFTNHGFYSIKDETWLENQRFAGKVLIEAIAVMTAQTKVGVSTKYINDIAVDIVKKYKDCSPTFLGYKDFPEAVCISLNEEIVHGIPKHDRILQDGDIITLDFGVTNKGAIADYATTFVVGSYKKPKHKALVDGCKNCLNKAIEFISNNLGKAKVGDIGYVITKEAHKIGATVISELGGHGLELNELHSYPNIMNYGDKGDGAIIMPNMTLCIEPMLVFGQGGVKLSSDNQTIKTQSIGTHFEKTIFIHKDSVEVITNDN